MGFSGYSDIQTAYDAYWKAQAWPIISTVCLVLGVIGAVVLFFTFLSARNDGKFTGFLGWIYEFLNFRKLLLEAILRIIYMVLAVWLVLVGLIYIFMGFGNFGQNLLGGLAIAILGNVLLRISYEFVMLLVSICKNVSDINRKLGGGKSSNDMNTPTNPFMSFTNNNRPKPPVNPQAPVQQNPAAPVNPVRPGAPVQQNPAAPVNPVRPGAPVQQNPVAPVTPARSGAPVQQNPVAPVNPVSSDTVPLNPAQRPVPPVTNATVPLNPAQRPAAPVQGGAAPMVFCRNCGKQFAADSAACPYCGTPRRK